MTTDVWAAVGTWAAILVSIAIATASGVRAVRADRRAAAADKRSQTADQRADEALELARSAEARADRLEQIAVEKRDVAWKQRPVDPLNPYTLSFQHVGTDNAYDVALVVDSAEHRFPRQTTPQLGQIEPASPIGINLTVAARDAAGHGTTLRDHMGLEPRIVVSGRITWRSQSGVPGIQDFHDIALLAPPTPDHQNPSRM